MFLFRGIFFLHKLQPAAHLQSADTQEKTPGNIHSDEINLQVFGKLLKSAVGNSSNIFSGNVDWSV